MEYKLFLQLLPKGKYARSGYYNLMSSRTLRFDVRLGTKTTRNYETLEEQEQETFSLCGSPTKAHSGDQGVERIVTEYRDRVPKDKLNDFDRLIEMWRKYHLNDLTAGTKKQEDAIEEWRKTNKYDYTKACEYLASIGLLEDRGYKYGTSWLGRPIPTDDINFIHRICNEWGGRAND